MPTITTKRGKTVCVGSVTVEGRRRQKTFPPNKKGQREAVVWEEEEREKIRTEIDAEIKKQIRSTFFAVTVFDWANKYLDFAQNRFAQKTFQEKRSGFKLLIGFIGPDQSVEEITPSKSLAFLSEQNEKRSGYAANKERKNLSVAWDWGTKYIESFPRKPNPFQAVDRFPEVRAPRYVPSENDFWTVFSLAEGQDKAMLATFLFLAARRGEVFRMRRSDIDWKNDRVRLWTRKRKGGTMEFDWLPMAAELKIMLLEWMEERMAMKIDDNEHVFVCLDRTAFCDIYYGKPFKARQHFMPRLCERAGVTPFGFHAIRHLTASILYQKGYSQSVIQSILRHKSPTTTARYIRSLGLDHVKTALDEGLVRVVELPIKKSALDGNRERT